MLASNSQDALALATFGEVETYGVLEVTRRRASDGKPECSSERINNIHSRV